MTHFEDPIQFITTKSSKQDTVHYTNLKEITQGGPEVGRLLINDQLIENYLFGGPCIMFDSWVFAPAYLRKLFGAHFKLAMINTRTLDVKLIGSARDLIYLEKVESGVIHFYTDLNKTDLHTELMNLE